MKFPQLVVLLPCQSLESLSLEREAAEAEQILSAWTALYHPVILQQAAGAPRWVSAESPPEDVAAGLVVIPQCAESSLPPGWSENAASAGTRVIRRITNREAIIAAALEGIAEPVAWQSVPLAGDFLALGFCHFVVELLTRQFRYMSNLDCEQFHRHLLDAVQQLASGDLPAAREHLRSAFDRLTEAREYFYPAQAHLIDLTLVAPSTLGENLRRELAGDRPVNLLISASVVEHMGLHDPESLALLKEALDKGNATLVGGEYEELELPLMAPEAVVGQLRRGLEIYEQCLGHRPVIFGRRRFGLSPLLPQILKNFGFTGALHFTLDDGQFPAGNQSKIRWEGLDGAEIDALARIPWEIDRPENFLRLPARLGDTLDTDQGATVVFAHWAGQTSPWLEDLRRMSQYGPVLGKFATLSTYFEDAAYTGQIVRYAADKYRSPYLRQETAADRPDPISRWVRHHRDSLLNSDAHAMQTLSALLSPLSRSGRGAGGEGVPSPNEDAAQLAAIIASSQEGPPQGTLFLNPRTHKVRWLVDVSDAEALPAIAPPILAAAETEGRREILLETPGMGFAWVAKATPTAAAEKPRGKKKTAIEQPLVVEQHELRNEFFQVRVSPTTGAIQSVQNYAVRGNRLGQQIAMRLPVSAKRRRDLDPEAEENYSLMAADEISASMLSPMVGRIVSCGRLMSREGKRLATFVQSITARRGSPVLELEIELDITRLPDPDPWKSYFAARFAWTDETADVLQGVGCCPQAAEGQILEAPHWIDIRSPRTRLTVFPAGLPYHRRYGFRKLDTLLVVHGETARTFRLGIGVDVKYPAAAALDVLAQPTECYRQASAASALTAGRAGSGAQWGWFFHLDARNVTATYWEPVFAEGRPSGFRVRLLETEGRRSELALRCFRPIASARRIDFLGGMHEDLPVDADEITVEVGPRQWTEVEASFAD